MSVPDDVRAEIDTLAAVTHAAMARHDLDAVLATMTEDVVLLTVAVIVLARRRSAWEYGAGCVIAALEIAALEIDSSSRYRGSAMLGGTEAIPEMWRDVARPAGLHR